MAIFLKRFVFSRIVIPNNSLSIGIEITYAIIGSAISSKVNKISGSLIAIIDIAV